VAKLKIVHSCVDVSIEVYYYKVWPNDVYIYIYIYNLYTYTNVYAYSFNIVAITERKFPCGIESCVNLCS